MCLLALDVHKNVSGDLHNQNDEGTKCHRANVVQDEAGDGLANGTVQLALVSTQSQHKARQQSQLNTE